MNSFTDICLMRVVAEQRHEQMRSVPLHLARAFAEAIPGPDVGDGSPWVAMPCGPLPVDDVPSQLLAP